MKVGIVGAGKRFFNVYKPILEKMQCSMFVWNRTKQKVESLKGQKGYVLVEDIVDFEDLEIDLCLCFLPPSINYSVLSDIEIDCPLLLETPVVDQRWLQKNNVGVLEQWIYLPVEQFKENVYESKMISRPYWVFNDGRSFEYHAIAQLRKYCQHQIPKTFKGHLQNVENEKGYINKNGEKSFQNYAWMHGNATLENGSFLTYNFSYSCKTTKLKPFQMLRAYSSDGSIISGRSQEMDNDYELFEVRYCDSERNVVCEKVKREAKNDTTISLSLGKLKWKNKYHHLNFSDQQTAIAYLIKDASVGKLYSAKNAYLDNLTMNGMKQAANNNSILKL
tara:strand:- start:3877 stop:4878 length:1002 start_codon:yes stop_codon:yes gene_type:complete